MKLEECIGSGRAYIIAEMSANHGGSLERALAIVDEAGRCGADCLKVQTFTADTITLDCQSDDFLVSGGLWDGSYYHDLYSEGSLPWEWHEPIMRRCEVVGLDFLSTPFDPTAVDFLEDLGVGAFKIASPELVDLPLIEYTASKEKPLIISTGMGSEKEISQAVAAAHDGGAPHVVLLQCCTQYPADFANMNLSLVPDMAKRFSCTVGLSDHSPGFVAPVVARTLGAMVIEKHFCLSHDDPGPDAGFSMTPADFKAMVKAVRDAESALGSPVYGPSGGEIRALRSRRSLFVCKDVKRGDVLGKDNVKSVRPALGLPPKYQDAIYGRTAARDIPYGTPLAWDMVEGGGPTW